MVAGLTRWDEGAHGLMRGRALGAPGRRDRLAITRPLDGATRAASRSAELGLPANWSGVDPDDRVQRGVGERQ